MILAKNLQNINGCAGTDPILPTAGTNPDQHYSIKLIEKHTYKYFDGSTTSAPSCKPEWKWDEKL